MRLAITQADSRALRELDTTRSDQTSGALNAFEGIFTGVVTGGLLWLGLVWFVFSLLRGPHF